MISAWYPHCSPGLKSEIVSMPNIDKLGDAPGGKPSNLREQFERKLARAAHRGRDQSRDDSVEPVQQGARSHEVVNPDESAGEQSGQNTAGRVSPTASGGGPGEPEPTT